MEKKVETNSVVMGYDDSHSTYSLEQPPPAYRKPEASSVKVAKVIAGTVIVLSIIIGAVVLGAVYIQTKNQCILIPQGVPFDTIAAESAPIPEALVQSPPAPQSGSSKKLEVTTSSTTTASESREEKDKDVEDDRRENDVDGPEHMHIPLQLDLDDITGQIMENNQRARVNCVIEKKKAEEIVTQSPKHLRTPFGNLTTDHRYMHITGETMTLSCRSGNARIMRPIHVDDDEPQEGPTAILIQTQPAPMPMPVPIQMRMGGGMPNHPGMQQHPRMQQHQHSGMQQHPNMQHHPDMQQRQQQMHNNQPHPMFPPQLMMGPGGPMMPPQAGMMMNGPHGMREPRAPENLPRVKRSVHNKLACSCTTR